MAEHPEAIRRLEAALAANLIAHEAVYDLHRRLVAAGVAELSSERLRESARITLVEAPAVAREAQGLARRWSEESVLDPSRARETRKRLAAEVAGIEPELRALLDRQVEIAGELRALLAEESS